MYAIEEIVGRNNKKFEEYYTRLERKRQREAYLDRFDKDAQAAVRREVAKSK